MIDRRRCGLLLRNFIIHVRALAVVSREANITPIMLSTICSSLKEIGPSPLSSTSVCIIKVPRKSLFTILFFLLSLIMPCMMSWSCLLAYSEDKNKMGNQIIRKQKISITPSFPTQNNSNSILYCLNLQLKLSQVLVKLCILTTVVYVTISNMIEIL